MGSHIKAQTAKVNPGLAQALRKKLEHLIAQGWGNVPEASTDFVSDHLGILYDVYIDSNTMPLNLA
jgi:hypothetical protein